MLKITCNVCGKESDNHYEFGNKKFLYVNSETNVLTTIHICEKCQLGLKTHLARSTAEYLGLKQPIEAINFSESSGI